MWRDQINAQRPERAVNKASMPSEPYPTRRGPSARSGPDPITQSRPHLWTRFVVSSRWSCASGVLGFRSCQAHGTDVSARAVRRVQGVASLYSVGEPQGGRRCLFGSCCCCDEYRLNKKARRWKDNIGSFMGFIQSVRQCPLNLKKNRTLRFDYQGPSDAPRPGRAWLVPAAPMALTMARDRSKSTPAGKVTGFMT